VKLITFDIFGTVLDWQRGLSLAVALKPGEFDQIIDVQGRIESGPYKTYREITALSLVEVLKLDVKRADEIGAGAGRWPLFEDSAASMAQLEKFAPCMAMTNSDRAHGEDLRKNLQMSDWLCAEDVRLYKPNPEFWEVVRKKRGIAFDKEWWHVSAYADYDLAVASRLGLTTVFIERPHSRPGPADQHLPNLTALAALLTSK
jgi:2-haloalkanoic acid dehalogenase type II